MDNSVNQRFGVEEIRRIREEDDVRYQCMTPEEISKDLAQRANEARKLMDKIRRDRETRQAV